MVYQPGRLEAVTYKKGRKRSVGALQTAAGKTEITLKPEKTELRANGQDLCFLNINLTGANGITRSSVDQKLKITVEGPGSLQAFGSARPHMAENFYSDTHTTYYGKALAVIRAGYEAGNIRVTVSGKGLETGAERSCFDGQTGFCPFINLKISGITHKCRRSGTLFHHSAQSREPSFS